ncbi:hypothetical protein EKH55_5769 (plasmid) [Sinorhizobium alkalisoli]|nr:hypothetical protein EKH55_5769 [Sinorhizobium alkalisoli]
MPEWGWKKSACRASKLVHAISNAFDGNAAAAKPFDVEKAQG